MLNQKNQARLDELKQKFEEISNKISDGIPLNEDFSDKCRSDWKRDHNEVMRRFKLFNSDKIFIVATGMLKAGKSTLVNLLARNENASPIGFGVDTTRRPALIMMVEDKDHDSESGIYVYKQQPVEHKPTDANANDEEKKNQYENEEYEGRNLQLKTIVDYIRGMNKLPSGVETSPIPLNQENLRKTLCEGNSDVIDQEPLLVVVKLPYNEESKLFKENNCVIFDMPGQDSDDARVSKDSRAYKAIFDECDLVLFIQSDVAPLNGTACDYLKEIGETRDGCTYRLVQNRMNARYWRRPDVLEDELREHEGIARRNFVKKLNTYKVTEDKLISWSANLGQAYDALFKRNELITTNDSIDEAALKLMESSKFFADDENQTGLEYHMCDDIKRNGEARRTQHCKDTLYNALVLSCRNIQDMIEDLDQKKQDKGTTLSSLSEQLNKIQNIQGQGGSFRGITFKASKKLEATLESEMRKQFDKVRDKPEFAELFPKNDKAFPKVKGSDFKAFSVSCDTNARTAVQNTIREAYLEDVSIGVDENNTERNALDVLNDKIMEINTTSNDFIPQIPLIHKESKKIGSCCMDVSWQPTQFDIREKYGKTFFHPIAGKEKPLDGLESSDIEGDSGTYGLIVQNYLRQVNDTVLNLIMRDVIEETLRLHIADCMKDKEDEKKIGMNKLSAEQSQLEEGKKVLEGAKEELLELAKDVKRIEL